MSLLTDKMDKTECVLYNKQTVQDGYGGYSTIWVEGVRFNAAIVENTSTAAQVAQKQGTTSFYTVTTSRALNLQFHDVFKRLTDGKVFRVTSDGDDTYTPDTATIDMRQVAAEEWQLT